MLRELQIANEFLAEKQHQKKKDARAKLRADESIAKNIEAISSNKTKKVWCIHIS